MTTRWHLVTGEYPPQLGGVSDYSASLAQALAVAGDEVDVWAPPDAAKQEAAVAVNIRVHRLPGTFDKRSLRELTSGLDACPKPRVVLVQYVPHAFGSRGMNLRFCRWVQRRARQSDDDIRVMFHEPYYPFGIWPLHRNLLALANRVMAALLLSDIQTAYVSTRAWGYRLGRYAPSGLRFVWLPIPASVPPARNAARVADWRARIAAPDGGHVIGHFGTFGAQVTDLVLPAVERMLSKRPGLRLCLIGPGSEACATRLCASRNAWRERVVATGRLPAPEVSACLKACDVALQPYADGASGRRTTLMAAMVNGVATVTNRGAATEDEWSASGAVALAARSTPMALCELLERILDDDAERGRLAAAAESLYAQRFSIGHTVATLMGGESGT